MKQMRKIIEIDEKLCNGCGECVPSCHEGAIQIIDGKARLVAERYCDGLGACLGECPTGALRIVERPAEAFDEEATEAHVAALSAEQDMPKPMAGGCPSAQPHQFNRPAAASRPRGGGCPSAQAHRFDRPAAASTTPNTEPQASELGHWPVQIKLVSPAAPFLDGADLLVAADCVPVAYAGFHRDFLADKAVMIGCPKFDNPQEYIQKFTDIFSQAAVRSVTVVVMQVPCCQGLPMIVQEGIRQAGRYDIPVEKVIISLDGQILERQALVA